jgi:hypothetical protein
MLLSEMLITEDTMQQIVLTAWKGKRVV